MFLIRLILSNYENYKLFTRIKVKKRSIPFQDIKLKGLHQSSKNNF